MHFAFRRGRELAVRVRRKVCRCGMPSSAAAFDPSKPLLFQNFADFADELSFDEQAASRRASGIGADVASFATDFGTRV